MGNLGDLSPQGSVAVGVIVGLISTSFQAIGLTLQRKSHILEDEKHPYDIRRPPYKRRRWQLGMLMFVISNIVGSTIQITTLPLPVLSTLQAGVEHQSGLVFNTIFATLILGEPFTRYSLVGTVLVCIGALLIAIFGAIGEPAHSLDQLLELLQRRGFILWMVGTAVMVLAILLGSKLLKYLTTVYRGKHSSIRHPSHSLLLAKSAVELLVRTIVDRVNQFNRWQSWVILLTMITLALSQLFYLHRGLKLCSTSVLYPFVFCIYNIIAILDGLIYFRQMSQLAGLHAGLIALGTIVLLSGVLCLSWRLEVIDSHASVTVPAPSQAALGPGMVIVDEHAHLPIDLELDEEDAQVGEREPLLQTTPPYRRIPHQRTPSLPLLTASQQRSSTDLDPASIWAELDDSDYDYTNADIQSPLLHRASIDPFKPRPRSKTLSLRDNALWGSRHPPNSPTTQHTWHSRKLSPSEQRRSSIPVMDTRKAQHKRHAYSEATRPRIQGYGTQEVVDPSDRTPHRRSPTCPSHVRPVAGPRSTNRNWNSTLGGAWTTSLRHLARWTGYRGRGQHQSSDDPECPYPDPNTEDGN
ncbi:hypothetical protein EYZ11_001405 [Aspergillus tanneri]|uniref:NIPA-like protein 3 n=1 Tax=Aspergillus tanneri TaxID=1220188 RepID=A0A4S3JUL0_9EURO|nr:hypothetical protein EYZ11_001405 [Aspergillus tanneri]